MSEEPKFEPMEETPSKSKFEGTHNAKRVRAFIEKNWDKYRLTYENCGEIVELFESGALTRFDQVTTMARSRADQRHIPFMEAVRDVVEDNKPQEIVTRDETATDERLVGLDKEKARLGYRGERGLPGDRIIVPRNPRTLQREENFRQAQTPPEEKPERKDKGE